MKLFVLLTPGYVRSSRWLCWGLLCVLTIGFAQDIRAQEPENTIPIVDREPFDRIYLKQAKGGVKPMEVVPLSNLGVDLSSGIPTRGVLKFYKIDNRGTELQVPWNLVTKVERYESMLLVEGQRLTKENKFDEAFEYFAKLKKDLKSNAALEKACNDFLFANARYLFVEARYDEAFVAASSLFDRDPTYPQLEAAINAIVDKFLDQRMKANDYGMVRKLTVQFAKQFKGYPLPILKSYSERLNQVAEQRLEIAQAAAANKDFAKARLAIQAVLEVRPDFPPAQVLAQQIHQALPQALVGVTSFADEARANLLTDWDNRRVRGLLEFPVARQMGTGGEGGIYVSPLGELVPSVDGMNLSITLNRALPGFSNATAYDIARRLLYLAEHSRQSGESGSGSELADLLERVRVIDPNTLEIKWKHPHVRPEGVLTLDLTSKEFGTSAPNLIESPFKLGSQDSNTRTFLRNESYPVRSKDTPLEVVEIKFDDEDKAIDALRSGVIDVLDRVSPWNLQKLESDQNIKIGEYALPTVHVLRVNPSSEILQSKDVRRAIAFAIDSQTLLDKVVVGNRKIAGFSTISGPFPIGKGLEDPIAYAYDRSVPQFPYERGVAFMLFKSVWTAYYKKEILHFDEAKFKKEVEEAEINKTEPPKPPVIPDMPPLVLAYVKSGYGNAACTEIEKNLKAAGIPIKLLPLRAEDLRSDKTEWDLLYTELAIWEPILDARRAFGPGGELESENAYLSLALRELDQARNWQDVPNRLREIHQIVYNELEVIPLWQTLNYFAYRKTLKGIPTAPMTLYDGLPEWEKLFDVEAK